MGGSCFGTGLFVQGSTLTFGGSGSYTVSDVIADQNGSGGSAASDGLGGTGGSSAIAKTGVGTLTLTGSNTYSGGTTVTGGLINFNSSNNFGSSEPSRSYGGGLQWATGTSTDISPKLAAFGAGGATFDTNGNNVTLASSLSGSGSLAKTGGGSLTLSSANAYTGATTITAARWRCRVSATSESSGVTVATAPRSTSAPAAFFVRLRRSPQRHRSSAATGSSSSTARPVLRAINAAAASRFSVARRRCQASTATPTRRRSTGRRLALKGNGSIASSAFVGFAGGGDTGHLADHRHLRRRPVQPCRERQRQPRGSKTLTITNGSSFAGVIQDGGIAGGTGGPLVIAAGLAGPGRLNTYTGSTTIRPAAR